MKIHRWIGILMLAVALYTVSMAQESAVTVPDLTGLNIPQAAAALNAVGLRLGKQTFDQWGDSAGIPQDTIGAQSIAAGENAEPGSAVDVTLLVTPNVQLIYDDNDLSVVNLAEAAVGLAGVTFQATDGNQAVFELADWAGQLRGGQCLQMWSVDRDGPKELSQCGFIQNWITTTDPAQHFWITPNGVTRFNVVQDGTVRATCNAAPPASQDQPTTCDLYLPAGSGDLLEYIYFVYTRDRFLAMNPSDDLWMRLNQTTLNNPAANQAQLGAKFAIGTPALFGSPDIVGNVRRLAPGQCVLFKVTELDNDPLPEDCNVIAQLDLAADEVFWRNDFLLTSTDDTDYTCTAAVVDQRTICIMPR